MPQGTRYAGLSIGGAMFVSAMAQAAEHQGPAGSGATMVEQSAESPTVLLEECDITWEPIWMQASGANEWWVEYAIDGREIRSAAIDVDGRGTIELEPAWGKWVGATPAQIARGDLVLLRATDTSGYTTETYPFAYLVEQEPITKPCVTECVPSCIDQGCGDDGCGGVCGACGNGASCDTGVCVPPPPCVPACSDAACGDDGCGAVCGVCSTDEICVDRACVPESCTPTWSPTWVQEDVSNPWWASFLLGGARIRAASLEVVGGNTVELAPAWGRWRAGLGTYVEMGTPVILHVENSMGQTASSALFGYGLGANIELDPCATTGAVLCAPLARGMVTLQFDDNDETQYRLALPLVRARGLPASFVLNAQPFVGQWPGYLTLAQGRALVEEGHEIVAHNFEHIPLSQLSPAAMFSQMTSSQSWLAENLRTEVRHYAAPDGEVNEEGRALAASLFDSYRSALGGMNYVGDSPYEIESDVVFAWTTTAEVKALIDAAREERAWRILVWHRFTTGQPDNNYPPAYTLEGFEAVLDHLLLAGVDVVTVEQGLARSSCAAP
ncbi:MAG: polysaccharide deacetylase family protein [Myxococcota bacterium]